MRTGGRCSRRMWYLVLVWCCLTSALPPSSPVPALLTSIGRALSYYQGAQEVSDGFVFGLLFIKGQLNATKLDDPDLRLKLTKLINLCDLIMENNPRPWSTDEGGEGIVTNMGRLKEDKPGLVLRDAATPVSYPSDLDQHFRQMSDRCILEVIQNFTSQECLGMESLPGATGYALSHQALYLTLAQTVGLNPSETTLDRLCNRILFENNYIRYFGIPENFKDLFIEQVAVCGMNNYKEFFTDSILRYTLSQQTEYGCFGYSVPQHGSVCEDHFSSVSLTTLSSFLYFHSKNVFI